LDGARRNIYERCERLQLPARSTSDHRNGGNDQVAGLAI